MKVGKLNRPLNWPALILIVAMLTIACSQQPSPGNTQINRETVPPPVDPQTLVLPEPIENTTQISAENFDQIKNGMSLMDVELIILGTSRKIASKEDDGKLSETYRWETADSSKYIEVSFVDEKVVGKNQKGLK